MKINSGDKTQHGDGEQLFLVPRSGPGQASLQTESVSDLQLSLARRCDGISHIEVSSPVATVSSLDISVKTRNTLMIYCARSLQLWSSSAGINPSFGFHCFLPSASSQQVTMMRMSRSCPLCPPVSSWPPELMMTDVLMTTVWPRSSSSLVSITVDCSLLLRAREGGGRREEGGGDWWCLCWSALCTLQSGMTGDIGEGQLPLCLCHHIITSRDSPTSVGSRSSVITDNNGKVQTIALHIYHYHLLLPT